MTLSPAPPESDPAIARLRGAIVAAGRRLGSRGLISAGEGNVSVRLSDRRLLITPSGLRKDELSPEDLVVVGARPGDGEAPEAGPRPSSDIAIHRAVYAARREVQAVIHAHLPAAMALTLAGEIPDPAALPETALLLPRLPFVPFAAAGSDELAAAIASALTEQPVPLPGAALLERHGAVAVGDGAGDAGAAVDQALDRLELVEVLCRTWRDALLVRAGRSALGEGSILRPPGAEGRRREREAGRQQ